MSGRKGRLLGGDSEFITFGNRAWNLVTEGREAEPVANPNVDASKITDLHGHLHETKRGIVDDRDGAGFLVSGGPS